MRNFHRGVFAVCLLILSGTAQAALIANGDFTTDTDTGLDWMDHSITAGLSFNQVTAELGAGGLYEGWQVATLEQAHDYLRNAGWIGPFDSNNTQNVGFVTHLQTVTTDSFVNDPLDDLGADRFVNDPASGIGILGLLDDFASGLGNSHYTFDPAGDLGDVNPRTSTFLVRASAVPVPAAAWLFLSGLTLLVGYARGRS